MEPGSVMFAALGTFNERVQAATGVGEGEHTRATPLQWALTGVGLDLDVDAVMALAEILAQMMGQTVEEHRDLAHEVLTDGLRQMFVVGALHEQERARREAGA